MAKIGDVQLIPEGQGLGDEPLWREYRREERGWTWTSTKHTEKSARTALSGYRLVERLGQDGLAGMYTKDPEEKHKMHGPRYTRSDVEHILTCVLCSDDIAFLARDLGNEPLPITNVCVEAQASRHMKVRIEPASCEFTDELLMTIALPTHEMLPTSNEVPTQEER